MTLSNLKHILENYIESKELLKGIYNFEKLSENSTLIYMKQDYWNYSTDQFKKLAEGPGQASGRFMILSTKPKEPYCIIHLDGSDIVAYALPKDQHDRPSGFFISQLKTEVLPYLYEQSKRQNTIYPVSINKKKTFNRFDYDKSKFIIDELGAVWIQTCEHRDGSVTEHYLIEVSPFKK